MMTASFYGRAMRIKTIETRTGNPMAVCSMAVDIPVDRSEDTQTEWVDVTAFGDQAEHLAALEDKTMISVMGRVGVRLWTDREGKERRTFRVVADTLMSAKSTRPTGGRKQAPAEFDDPIPFGAA